MSSGIPLRAISHMMTETFVFDIGLKIIDQ